jgi:hypothetical protein
LGRQVREESVPDGFVATLTAHGRSQVGKATAALQELARIHLDEAKK